MKYYKIIGVLIILLIITNYINNKFVNKNWYSDGNLHKSNINEWKNADKKNKLATCADFVSKFKASKGEKYNSNINMKADAIYLKNCIDEATINESSNETKISEIAALCILIKFEETN